VAQHVHLGIAHGPEDPLRHLLLGHLEAGVDRGDDEVQLGQDLPGVVQRPVLENVHLGAAQNRYALLLGHLARLLHRVQEVPRGRAVGDAQGGAVIGEAYVLVPQPLGLPGQLTHGGMTVAHHGVHVEVAAYVLGP